VIAVATLAPYERQWNAYPRVPAYDANGEMPANLLVDEYTFVEKVKGLAATMDTFVVLYPQLDNIDFRQQATLLDVPVYLVQGAHEARGRAVLAREWFDMLVAPHKQLITFEQSGHRPLFEEPGRFYEVMTEIVLAETYPNKHYSQAQND
jgi:pimeloyl-ACP methyl ester carboxylesterase